MAKTINSANRKKQDSTGKNGKDIQIKRTSDCSQGSVNSNEAKQAKAEAGRQQRLAVVRLRQRLEAAKK